MLPRRCKKCRCYIAPQLTRCPRCRAKAPPILSTKQSKEEKKLARARQDAKVPMIRAAHMHWIPSAFSLRVAEDTLKELDKRLQRADTARLRNGVRNEIRLTKAHLARAKVPPKKRGWTTEIFRGEEACINVYVSPKGHRYVLADKDSPADLLIEQRPNSMLVSPYTRLQRFEKSRYGQAARKVRKQSAEHKKRKHAKRVQRAKRKKLKTQS